MKIVQVVAVLALSAILCSARVCQDGSLVTDTICDVESVYVICAKYCTRVNPDGCD
ncbi:hypothetical protein BGZ97_011165, partial [Linnemannia gamsii]